MSKSNATLTHDDYNSFRSFVNEFKNESDRAAVILGAAKLDVLLYQLLQSFLRPSTSKSDDLLDGDSPLATFSSKITISHRLGLIDDTFCKSLHLIRKIRNSFAHEISGISLDSGSHRDRIKELIQPLSKNDAFEYLHETYFGEEKTPGTQFRTVIALASLRIEGAIEACSPCASQPWALINQDFKKPDRPANEESAP